MRRGSKLFRRRITQALTQRSFLLLHLTHVCQVALTNLCSGVLLIIRQDLCRLVHQSIRALQWGPQRGSSLHPFGQKLLQQL